MATLGKQVEGAGHIPEQWLWLWLSPLCLSSAKGSEAASPEESGPAWFACLAPVPVYKVLGVPVTLSITLTAGKLHSWPSGPSPVLVPILPVTQHS